jgi:ribosome-associated protein
MRDALKIALNAVEDKKAFDITVLDISGIASFASYFLLCSGDSSRQIQAIADAVEARMKEGGYRTNHIEGYRNAEWVLLDYLDLVVHIFSKNARAYYDLERLWRDAKRLDEKKLLQKTKALKAAARPARKRKSGGA